MITLSVLALFLVQAGVPLTQTPPVKQNLAPVPMQPAPNKFATSPGIDRLFVAAATQCNNAELDMAQLALKHGQANEVIGFAEKMLSEHEAVLKDMQSALSGTQVASAPAERLAARDSLALRHLETVPTADFDQGYALAQIAGHLGMLTVFQAEADNGTDSQLKMFAKKWIPSIQSHLELAVDMTQHIGGSSPFKTH